MANIVYDRRRRRHHHHHHKTTIFLPIFCRLSLKDTDLGGRRRLCSSLSDEPSSPRISCMGQVKRNNHRVAASSPAADHQHKYSKLRKIFSGKALLPPASGGGGSGSKSCRSSKEACRDDLRRLKLKKDCVEVVDVRELDPPLPVRKRAAPPGAGRDEVNLWKRRFNGAAEIGKIRLPNCEFSQL